MGWIILVVVIWAIIALCDDCSVCCDRSLDRCDCDERCDDCGRKY